MRLSHATPQPSVSITRRPTAFSLVELLVVISIVSLLISILLPSLSSARETTRKLSCLSNERGVGNATLNYAVDNRGFGTPTTYNSPYQWHRPTTAAYTDVDGVTYPAVQGMDNYLGYSTTDPLTGRFYYRKTGCANYVASWTGNGDGTAYAGNHFILGLANTTAGAAPVRDFWLRLEDPRVGPTITGLFVESYHGQARDFSFFINGRPNTPYVWGIRHTDGLNVFYVDGHGKFARMTNAGAFLDDTRFQIPGVTR